VGGVPEVRGRVKAGEGASTRLSVASPRRAIHRRLPNRKEKQTMGELDHRGSTDNINVTLDQKRHDSLFAGRVFPCCICSANLDIRLSKRKKPYCTCIQCGIQIFFRGKSGIDRLAKILNSNNFVHGIALEAVPAIVLYNRIAQMRSHKKQLEVKQGLITRDLDLENAIRAVDNEIKCAQGELEKLSRKDGLEKHK